MVFENSRRSSAIHAAMSFARALAWPGVILFLVVSFWTPLQRISHRLSPLVERIESVSVGGVKFNVGKAFIEKRASAAVRAAVNTLQPSTLKHVLEHERGVRRTTRTVLDPEEADLIAAGLCTELNWRELDEMRREDTESKVKYMAGMSCGSKYEDVRVFLLELVPELIKRTK